MESWSFWEKSIFFLSFPHIMWNIFATSNEIGRVVNLAFIISSRTFWGKRNLNETVFRFSPSFDCEQETLGRVLISAFYASRGTLWRRTVFWNDLFFQFGWMTSGAVENRNLNVQKNIFGDFLLKKSVFCFDSRTLSKNLVTIFGNCFRQFFQNWHPCVQKNKLRRQVVYGKSRFFLSFPDFER